MGACCSKLLALFQGTSQDRSGYNTIPDTDNEAKERLLKEKKPSSHLEQIPTTTATSKPKSQVPVPTSTSSQSQVRTVIVVEVSIVIPFVTYFPYRLLKSQSHNQLSLPSIQHFPSQVFS